MDAVNCGENDTNDLATIFDLPPELLLQIFSLIDTKTLFRVVIYTCRRFQDILTIDGIWKTLFALKWKECSIVKDLSYVKDWEHVCYNYEDIDRFWRFRKQAKINLVSKRLTGHYGSIDSVFLTENEQFCISGSRDRSILVYDIQGCKMSDPGLDVSYVSILQGHEGWVWALDAFSHKENEFVSGSWDKKIKVWDLQEELCINTFTYHQAAILALCCHDNVFTTGCFDKHVRTFDPRSNSVVIESKHHTKPVLSLQVTDKYILSGSEDKTICVFDVRAGKLFTTLRIDSPVLCMNLALEQGLNYLRIGGNNGSFYIYDLTDDRFTLLDSSQLWKQHKINGLCNFQGSLTACKQGSVRVYTPSRNTEPLKTLDQYPADISSVHSRKSLLATGRCDNSVTVWKFVENL